MQLVALKFRILSMLRVNGLQKQMAREDRWTDRKSGRRGKLTVEPGSDSRNQGDKKLQVRFPEQTLCSELIDFLTLYKNPVQSNFYKNWKWEVKTANKRFETIVLLLKSESPCTIMSQASLQALSS